MANKHHCKIVHLSSALQHRPHRRGLKLSILWPENPLSAGVHVSQKMNRKEQRDVDFFKYSALLSLSSFMISSQRKPADARRRAVMWCQCLGPCGIVPSGGKPLKLCWYITPPIINNRTALSFLLHLSSFLSICSLSPLCLRSHLCPRLLYLHSPLTLSF